MSKKKTCQTKPYLEVKTNDSEKLLFAEIRLRECFLPAPGL
jgi:hypothetical protein